MWIHTDETGTLEGLAACIERTLADGAVKGLLVLCCDANGFRPETANPLLTTVSVPLVGGIFPSLIHGRAKMDRGSIVVGIPRAIHVQVIPGLSDAATDFEVVLETAAGHAQTMKTMLVFVDGFAKRIGAFIDSLFNVFGLELNYVGGGAGSLCMEQKPCLITNAGLLQDGAVLALLDVVSGVGVCHGWESVSGPFKVTASDGNVVLSLDWKPAFEVYRDVVEGHSRKRFDGRNFFDIAKAYPFGIAKLGTERIVRDPLKQGDRGALVCVGEVPAGCFVDILHGDERSLVDAAGKALAYGKAAFRPREPKRLHLFIDCISRVLFLGDRFSEELGAVYDERYPLIGACTIGEVANSGTDYLEFYNKTSVVAILETA